MSLTDVLLPSHRITPTSFAHDGAALTADLAIAWACTPARWRHHVRHLPAARWYRPLFTNDQINAWLITWAPGTSLDLHDHGDAAGTIAVVEGTLTERYASTERPSPLTTRRLRPGSLTTFEADHLHEVRNDGSTPAISIHVYTPSLDTMTFYPTGPHERRDSDDPVSNDDLARDDELTRCAHLVARAGSWL